MRRVPAAALILALCGVGLVSARQQQPAFRSGSDTVSVYATVLDRAGRLVSGLSRDDFEVFDNGRRQNITVFANDLQPITIVVMLDRSGSMVRHFDLVRRAAERFVGELEPNDRARVGSFSNRIRIDPAEFTSDREALVHVLRTRLQDPGTTPLWRATAQAMDAVANEPGRRVVLLFTDGHDTPDAQANPVAFADVRDRSVSENIMVYGIGFSSGCSSGGSYGSPWPVMPRFQRRFPRPGRMPPPIMRPPRTVPPLEPRMPPDIIGRRPGSPAPDVSPCAELGPDPNLRQLAHVGGGGYFELRNGKELDETFARVADELHQQYLLAFTPEVLDGQVHTIEVRVRSASLTARARQSYLAAED
jgi:Ca-activated chloride channel family protein